MPIIRHGYATKTRNGSTRAYRKARAQILAGAQYCGICGQPLGTDRTADHIIPHAHGGSDQVHNLRPAHERCNKSRGKGGMFTGERCDGHSRAFLATETWG